MTTLLPRGERAVRAPAPTPTEAEVSVNGVRVPPEAIAREMQNHPTSSFRHSWEAAAASLAIREILLQEARRLEIAPLAGSLEAGRQAAIDEAVIDGLIKREVIVETPDGEDLQRFYSANPALFRASDVVEASHILIRARRDDQPAFAAARERAEALAKVLAADPGSFADLARAHSDCPSAAAGGALGAVALEELTPEFAAAVGTLGDGETTIQPVEARYGFHLIRLDRRQRGEVLPFAAVRDQAAVHVMKRAERSALVDYLRRLVSAATVAGIDLARTGALAPV